MRATRQADASEAWACADQRGDTPISAFRDGAVFHRQPLEDDHLERVHRRERSARRPASEKIWNFAVKTRSLVQVERAHGNEAGIRKTDGHLKGRQH